MEGGERIDQVRSLKMYQVELTKSEIGCYLSHFRTIKNAYKKGLETICILEDDVLIEPNFGEILRALETLPDKYEHIRLMGLKIHKRKNVCNIYKQHNLTRPVKGPCGAQAYVLNRSGMKKILSHGEVISEPIDKLYDHFWDIDLWSYCIEPHAVWERSVNESSIIKKCRNKATQPFGKWLEKQVTKIKRGFKRRAYLLKYWNDFFPATKPVIPIGKTERIR